MNKFIGRKEELASLEKLYRTPGFQMSVVYGRRRIGKTTLLNKFMEGKRGVYYTAVRTSAQRNTELFCTRLVECLAPEREGMSFTSLESAFRFLTGQCEAERVVVVLDEFPYWAETDKSLTSFLQKWIDLEWLSGNMMLILSGSSVSFMEEEILGAKSPLFGRRTSQLRLNSFPYWEAGEFVPSWSAADKAVCYGVTGGIAKYLELFDEDRSLDDNLVELFFSRDGYLYEEPSNLLAQEFRSVFSYSAVIEAIAAGAGKMNEIADRIHLDSSNVAHILTNLISTGIVNKKTALTEETNKKKALYVLRDGMFRFWYRYIPGGNDLIQAGKGRVFYERAVRPHLSECMGSVFEDMARDYTLSEGTEGRWGFIPLNVGQWWGTNPKTRIPTDIDVVGINKFEKKALIGECKYKNEILDKSVLDDLKERNGLLDPAYEICSYLLFSKSGFSDWILENAEKENAILIGLEEMYERDREPSPVSYLV